MRSDRTKTCIRKKWKYQFFSWFLCFGVFLGLLVYGFITKWSGGNNSEFAYHIKALLTIALIAMLPLVLLSLLVKDKIKPTIRMMNVILAAYLVANWFMYIVGSFMLFDTYILNGLINKYKASIIANKEIDKRYE